jgi:Fe2+ or Zn2+ uptake regulation protein
MGTDEKTLKESLAKSGRRMTRQRQAVYENVLRYKNHPTADEVFGKARHELAGISLATVYKSLEALVATGRLAKVPRVDEVPARYDHRLDPHLHMRCVDCGKVWDIGKDAPIIGPGLFRLPDRLQAVGYIAEVRVKCPVECPLCPRKHSKL